VDAALVALTAVLAVATLVYAGFAGWLAWETRETRRLSVRPKLGLRVVPIGPNNVMVAVRSLGPGVARDVDVKIQFTPVSEARPWRVDVFPPDEEIRFLPPEVEGSRIWELSRLQELDVVVTLTGSARDIGGDLHQMDDELRALGGSARGLVSKWNTEAKMAACS
jgi:hypothetical protein